MLNGFIISIQLFFTVITGCYFLSLLLGQNNNKKSIHKDSKVHEDKLNSLRAVSLTVPLSETTRPQSFEEIVGQDKGLLALKAALCSSNPQHVIIYGGPGVGKTAAARLALDAAKGTMRSPFSVDAKFIEIDATTLRFDERGVADPLIGSVHDPIYQGAGSYGSAGIPTPKAGAVTKAHGGVLFIDEIGELHSIQMNKLLKVLEDRKVKFESSYYSPLDNNIPKYIHDIFQRGLPADFRLVGATTRQPSEIAPALRSRCMEIFFDPLGREDIEKITKNAIKKARFCYEAGVVDMISSYCSNGRDAVNMVQMAASIAGLEYRGIISLKDIEWVIETGQYSKMITKSIEQGSRVGVVNGVAIGASRQGFLMEIEVSAYKVYNNEGNIFINGIIEEEKIHSKQVSSKRKSSAKSSIENAITLFRNIQDVDLSLYNIYINYPGSTPVDGPSSGLAVFIAIYSAIFKKPVPNDIVITGEIGIQGMVYPVGGVYSKARAAKVSGARCIVIPKDNDKEILREIGIDIVPVSKVEEVIKDVFNDSFVYHRLEDDNWLNA